MTSLSQIWKKFGETFQVIKVGVSHVPAFALLVFKDGRAIGHLQVRSDLQGLRQGVLVVFH